MNNIEDVKNLRNTYIYAKGEGKQQAFDFLHSIVSYCRSIGFDKFGTKMMLALVVNRIPMPGQEFTDCCIEDEVYDEYFTKLFDKEYEALGK